MHLDPPPQPSFTAVPAMAAAMDLALRSLHATLVHQWGPTLAHQLQSLVLGSVLNRFTLSQVKDLDGEGIALPSCHAYRSFGEEQTPRDLLGGGSIGSGVQGPKSYDATTMSLVETRSGARPACH